MSSSLIKAVRSNDIEKVKTLLSSGKSVTLADSNGWTSVHHASYCGHYEILRLLLEGSSRQAKEYVSRLTWHSETPLFVACTATKINTTVIHYLLSQGADPNARTMDGKTPIHAACESNGNLSAVRALRDMGADINMIDDIHQYNSLLMAITASKDVKLARYLLKYSDANCTRYFGDSNEVYLRAALYHMPEVVTDILKLRRTPPSSQLLSIAAQKRNIENVCQLLEAGVAPVMNDLKEVCRNVDDFKAIIKSISPSYFDQCFIEACQEEYLEDLFEYLSVAGIEMKVEPSVKKSILKFFPVTDARYNTLKEFCRPAVRSAIVSYCGDSWTAYRYLKNSLIPAQLKKFLLYEI